MAKTALRRRQGDAKAATRRETGTVRSVVRALSLLRTLAGTGDGLTLSELAELSGLPLATTHRLLVTLEAQRFVRFETTTGVWQVGVEAFTVGSAFARSRDLALLARPIMRRLVLETGETCNLAIEDEGEAVYLAQIESREMMRAIARRGGRVKMHCSALGKAVLAWLPDEALTAVLQRHGLPAMTTRTLTSPRALRAELARIRERGYAIDDEEYALGLRCVAAAVFDEHGTPFAGLSISGPTVRIPDARIPALGNLVREAAASLTAAYGGRPPAS
ncbi:Transcriptional repressor IclR [bacterium HR40]|nr:Transcriptional repressor IclR [bacterium HR40]